MKILPTDPSYDDSLEVDAAWARIESAFEAAGVADQLHAGASAEDIEAMERALDATFPDQLRRSLARHNGADDWPTGELLSLDRIQDEAKVWRELLADGTFDDNADHDASEGTGEVKRGWWVQGWIPLDADGAGNGAAVDTDPGPEGEVGQIVDMDHEVGPSGPKFASVADYLADLAGEIESGAITWTGGAWERV